MKAATTPPRAPAPAPDPAYPLKRDPSDSVEELLNAVEQMTSFAQEFYRIAVIARLALAQLERPCGSCEYEDIAQALVLIERNAMEAGDGSDFCAEEVGCQYIDKAARLRSEAMRGMGLPFHRELMDNCDERAV